MNMFAKLIILGGFICRLQESFSVSLASDINSGCGIVEVK